MVQSPAAKKSDNLTLRVASSLILAPLALAAIWYGGVPFTLLLAAMGGLAGYEWANLMNRDAQNTDLIGQPLALVATVLVGGLANLGAAIALISVSAVAIAVFAVSTKRSHPALQSLGFLYIGAALLAMLSLRLYSTQGLAWSLLLCAVVWATDIGAYAAGRTIGGPKLAPAISPGKTWAGFAGGVAAATVAAIFIVSIFEHWPLGSAIVLAVVLAITAQMGDLLESFFKRRSGAGDSGRLIPGHGGILDRIDGLMPAAMLLCAVVLFAEPGQSLS